MMTNTARNVLKFDGQDDYIVLPAMNIDSSQGIAIEAWVYYNSFKSFSRIIDFGNGAGADNILLANNGRSNALALHLFNSSTGQALQILQADAVLSTGKWMHLAVTVDASGNAKLYNNGQEIKSGSLSLPDSVNRAFNYIGKSNWSVDGYFDGQITEVRLWNRVRTQEEITNDMNHNLLGNEPGLVGYWPLSEGSGNIATDKTGNGNNGTIDGASWTLDTSLSFNPSLTGQFEVLGNSDTGYAFVNNQNQTVSYTFTPSGTWSPNVNDPNVSGCTAEGLPSLNPDVMQYFNTAYWPYMQYLKYPTNTCYSLVAQNQTTGTTTEVGKQTTIVLNPGETLIFVLNDWPNDYTNNSGSIKVDYSGIY
jgi:hypothetical protein